MTPEQTTKLQQLIDSTEVTYEHFCSAQSPLRGDPATLERCKGFEAAIFDYVDSLLAAKDTEIAALRKECDIR